ncbi:unnamed protein product [Caenorhabditis auriculariae]|uniref:M-phase inducer phosphatase n=1 Tax=Caenorhabditis auriculariae TaxID=2777116 RepID=A0A8S1HGK4_9PELO|nr:unnamed protein product [Caenorhabditis auriculariae]
MYACIAELINRATAPLQRQTASEFKRDPGTDLIIDPSRTVSTNFVPTIVLLQPNLDSPPPCKRADGAPWRDVSCRASPAQLLMIDCITVCHRLRLFSVSTRFCSVWRLFSHSQEPRRVAQVTTTHCAALVTATRSLPRLGLNVTARNHMTDLCVFERGQFPFFSPFQPQTTREVRPQPIGSAQKSGWIGRRKDSRVCAGHYPAVASPGQSLLLNGRYLWLGESLDRPAGPAKMFPSRNQLACAPVRRKKMSEEFLSGDSDSRDSGVSDMDITDMPTSFACTSQEQKSCFNIDIEMDGMDLGEEEENQLIIEEFSGRKSSTRTARALSDVTSSYNNRQNTLQPAYNESPVSRKTFLKPSATKLCRKRTFGGVENSFKRIRAESIDENEELQPTCSTVGRRSSSFGSTTIHRVQSLSVLERGESYASHVSADLPTLPEIHYGLRTISPSDSQAFRRISAETLVDLLHSLTELEFSSRYVIIDCRYSYEYFGGHIRSALNVCDPTDCTRIFYESENQGRIPIFYCEYSQKRGPTMAYALRTLDRQRNLLSYPHCDYKEMYVLDKGYKNFYEFTQARQISSLCSPMGYTRMDDVRFTEELKQYGFHKKNSHVTAASAFKNSSRAKGLLRQRSAESPSAALTSQRSSRRPLFGERLSPIPSQAGESSASRTPSPVAAPPALLSFS